MKAFDFGLHAQSMKLRSARSVVIANNIANSETPNFKARDMDVVKSLQGGHQGAPMQMRGTQAGHMATPAALLDFSQTYSEALQGSLDGNTVDPDAEKVKFSDNAMRYQASLTFLNGTISTLRKALGGE